MPIKARACACNVKFVSVQCLLHTLLLYVVVADIYTNAINVSHKLDESSIEGAKNSICIKSAKHFVFLSVHLFMLGYS